MQHDDPSESKGDPTVESWSCCAHEGRHGTLMQRDQLCIDIRLGERFAEVQSVSSSTISQRKSLQMTLRENVSSM